MAVCRCGRTTTSTTQAHCVTCHAQFSGMTAFDRHRRRKPGAEDWDRECWNPAHILDNHGIAVLEAHGEKHGIVWRFAGARDFGDDGDAA